MRYAFRAVVVAGFVLGLLLGFLAFDVAPARAQTPTPTPHPFPSPTPICGSAGCLPATPDYIWYCVLSPGAAPVCSWGDYVEVSAYAHSASGLVDDPMGSNGDTSLRRRVIIVPPYGAKRVEGVCSTYRQRDTPYMTSAAASVGVYVHANQVASIAPAFASTLMDVVQTYSVTLGIVSGGAMTYTLPTAYSDYPIYPGIAASAVANVIVPADGRSAFGYAAAACQFTKVVMMDNSEYVPPPAVPWGDATPTGPGWEVTPWASDPWVPVPNPEPIGLEVTPGETECLTLLPAADFPDVTIGGSTYSLDFPGASVCLEQYSVSLEMLGIDFGVLVVAVVTLGGIGIVYTVFKKG